MSWQTVNKNNSRTRIGVESTMGTAATTMVDIVLTGDAAPLAGSTTKMLPRTEQRRRRRDFIRPVKGLESESPFELTVSAKRLNTRLNAAASPVPFDDVSALSHQILWRAVLGGELAPEAGSTVASTTGTPITTVTVATGHGTRFVEGQWITLTDNLGGLHPRWVTAIATDALSIFPPLNATLANGSEVRNAYNFFPAEADSQTFTVDHAFVESGSAETQQRGRGCTGQGEVTLTVGEVPTIKWGGQSVAHDGPGDLSISTDATLDDMGEPFCWEPVIYAGTLGGGGAPTVSEISELKVTVPRTFQKVMGPGVEGVTRIVDVASHGAPIMVEMSGHMGASAWSQFNANTQIHLIAYTVDGSGNDARCFGFHCPRLVLAEEPAIEMSGELVFFRAKYLAQQNTVIDAAPESSSTPEIALANVTFFLA